MGMEINVSEHVEEYIKRLSNTAEKNQIDAYMHRQAELGHMLKRPVSAALRDGINEIRPGAIRILFFYFKGEIVLIHAFRKNSREVPAREIEAAIRLRERYIKGEIK